MGTWEHFPSATLLWGRGSNNAALGWGTPTSVTLLLVLGSNNVALGMTRGPGQHIDRGPSKQRIQLVSTGIPGPMVVETVIFLM